MAQYPTVPKPQMPYELTSVFKTLISGFDSGKEQRREKQTYAKYDVSLTYNALSSANLNLLWNFYMARHGDAEAFYFYTLETDAWANLFIGTGDASTFIFDLPGKSTSSQTIYYNGTALGSGYAILTGGGTESSDRVQFTAAPDENVIITCDLTGYMRIRCRFEDPKMSKKNFMGSLYQTGIKLKGLTAL